MTTGVDLIGEALPNWIIAVSSALTLIAAVGAGVYAARAAHWTKEQAKTGAEQVEISRRNLRLAEGEALTAQAEAERRAEESRRQLEEAAAARRREEERRLDALIPSIFASALPGVTVDSNRIGIYFRRGTDNWEQLTEPLEFTSEDRDLAFLQVLYIRLRNLGSVPARIDFTDTYGGELTFNGELIESGTPLYVLPDNVPIDVSWSRRVSAMAFADTADHVRPEHVLFRPEFLVRDVGMNVGDTYRMSGVVADVRRDGSRLIAHPSASGWSDRAAVPVERVYERLVAADLAEAEAASADGSIVD